MMRARDEHCDDPYHRGEGSDPSLCLESNILELIVSPVDWRPPLELVCTDDPLLITN